MFLCISCQPYNFLFFRDADKLLSLINKKQFKNILEIGSYSGILTKKIVEKFDFESLSAFENKLELLSAIENKNYMLIYKTCPL